ncbi:hypothetical protein ACFSE1_18655 [Rhizobium helianthi]|uniref:Uncharacterized protein n=1 Tax=Rhizobium helianthi TaxID=1132695 RepID=A0ABW4MAG2_9HYPH
MNMMDMNFESSERREEYFALINMIGYALSIAESLGAKSAAMHMEAARQSLVTNLQDELSGVLTKEGISQIATARAGHC